MSFLVLSTRPKKSYDIGPVLLPSRAIALLGNCRVCIRTSNPIHRSGTRIRCLTEGAVASCVPPYLPRPFEGDLIARQVNGLPELSPIHSSVCLDCFVRVRVERPAIRMSLMDSRLA